MSVYGAMDYLGLLSNIPDKIRRERILALLEHVNLKRKYADESKGFIRGNEKTTGDCAGVIA